MQKCLSILVILGMSGAMMGCTPGHNVPGATASGAIAGGLVGNELFHGKGHVPGIIGSSLVGGIIGDQVGQSMDRNDQARANYYNSPPPNNYYYPNYNSYPNNYNYAPPPRSQTYYVYPGY